MPTYEELNATHPDRDESEGSRLEALYRGGKHFKARLGTFLPQHEREKPETYEARKREVDYRNYVGPIIDFFTALLFSSRPNAVAAQDGEPVVNLPDYWEEFREDADGHGADLDAVAKTWLTTGMIRGCGWVRVHAPDDQGQPAANAKDFEDRGLGDAWITHVDPASVLDWEHDDSGTLEFVVVHRMTQKRQGSWGPRNLITETWERLTATEIETYSITYESNKKPSSKDEVGLVGVRPHPFGRVPMVPLRLPEALHVASRLELPQLSHFRLLNALHWSLRQSCFAQPVFKVEDASNPPVMGAGIGIMIGPTEEMEWNAPPSGHFASLAAEIGTAKDEIFRIAHQMALGVENNAAAVGRSGDSKQQDALQTKVVLLAFSRMLKEGIEVICDMISRARGEDFTWSIEGLDDFASADIYGLLEALESLDKVGGIHSNTFRAEMEKRLADAFLPDLEQAMKQTIKQEIDSGVADEANKESELDGMIRELRARPAPQVPPQVQQKVPPIP